MRNNQLVRQIVWKEYRQQRSFWLALVIAAVLCQLVIVITAVLDNQSPSVEVLCGLAFGFPCLFAVGSGATFFAGEHESGTYLTLRAWPSKPGPILAGKMIWAAGGMIGMPLVLLLTALAFSKGTTPIGIVGWNIVLGGLVTSIELLAWGMFFSLQMKRPLRAVVFAAAAASLVGFVVVPLITLNLLDRYESDWYLASLPGRAVIAAIVLCLDVWLAHGWLDETPRRLSRLLSRRLKWFSLGNRVRPQTEHRYAGSVVRLLWQEWQQSKGLLVGIASLHLVLPLLFIISSREVSSLVNAFAVLPGVATILGACVFLSDQSQNSFRFFAERGVSGRRIWVARHLFWGSILFLWTVIWIGVVAAVLGANPEAVGVRLDAGLRSMGGTTTEFTYQIRNDHVLLFFGVLGLSVVAYCAAQVGSIYMRSGIVGFFVGVVMSFLACWWCIWMTAVQVPLIWSVVPLPLLLLWASWLRANDWIVERTSLMARAKAAFSLGSPVILVLAVIAYRVSEFPAVSLPPTDEVTRQARPEERTTADLYSEALAMVISLEQPAGGSAMGMGAAGPAILQSEAVSGTSEAPSAVTATEPNQTVEQILAKFLEASNRPSCRFPPMQAAAPLVPFILDQCGKLEAQGKPDEAFELYMGLLRLAKHLYQSVTTVHHVTADSTEADSLERIVQFSARPMLKSADIRKIRERLEREAFSFTPDRQKAVLSDHVFALENMRQYRIRYLPWENHRGVRLVRYYTDLALRELSTTEDRVRSGVIPIPSDELVGFVQQKHLSDHLPASFHANAAIQHETNRRAARIRLAALEWRAEHGELPEQLGDLASILGEVPLDPYRGSAFLYRKHGYDFRLPKASSNRMNSTGLEYLAPGEPFLWSVGPRLGYAAQAAVAPAGSATYAQAGAGSSSAEQYWMMGLTYEIPSPSDTPSSVPD